MKFTPDKLVLPLFGIVFAAALILASGIKPEEDFMALIPGELRKNGDYRKILDTFKPMDKMIVLASLEDETALPPEVLPEDWLAACTDELYAALEGSGLYKSLMYRWTMEDYTRTQALLDSRRFQLFDETDYARIEALAAEAPMRTLLEEWKRELYTSSDPFALRQLQADPLKLGALTAAKWDGLGTTGTMTLYEGRLSTADYRNMMILAEPAASGSDSRAAEGFVRELETEFARLEKAWPGVKIHWMTGHRYTFENARRIKRDVGLTVTLSFILILGLALLSYRRPLFSLLALIPSFFGFTVALAVCRLFFREISGIIVGCGSMLIGITVDYGIHLLFHADSLPRSDDFRQKVTGSLNRIRVPLLLSALTTIAAFSVLLFSRIPGYRQLGLFAGIGVGASLLFVLFAFPRLIPRPMAAPPLIRLPRPDGSRLLAPLFGFLTGRKPAVLLAALVLAAASVPGLLRVRFDGNISSMNAKSAAMADDETIITGRIDPFHYDTYVAVSGATEAAALTALVPVEETLAALEVEGLVEDTSSLLSILPPPEEQERRFARYRALTAAGTWKKTESTLVTTAATLGLKGEKLSPAVKALAEARYEPLTAASFDGTVLEPLAAGRIGSLDGTWLALTMVRLANPSSMKEVRDRLFAAHPGIILYNETAFAGEILDLIYGEMKRLGLIIAAVILTLILLFTRNIRKALAILLPIAFSFLLTFGLFGWLDIKINLMNCLVIIFIFGLVVDYSIFMVSALWYQPKEGGDSLFRDTSSRAILLSAFTTMAGLGVLVLASHPALKTLGAAAVTGITSGLVSVFMLSPAIISLLRPKAAGQGYPA
jgi:predicted exporter